MNGKIYDYQTHYISVPDTFCAKHMIYVRVRAVRPRAAAQVALILFFEYR